MFSTSFIRISLSFGTKDRARATFGPTKFSVSHGTKAPPSDKPSGIVPPGFPPLGTGRETTGLPSSKQKMSIGTIFTTRETSSEYFPSPIREIASFAHLSSISAALLVTIRTISRVSGEITGLGVLLKSAKDDRTFG